MNVYIRFNTEHFKDAAQPQWRILVGTLDDITGIENGTVEHKAHKFEAEECNVKSVSFAINGVVKYAIHIEATQLSLYEDKKTNTVTAYIQ